MSLIGIDVGTTGCKCTLFDNEENVIAQAYREYFFENTADGIHELDARKVWEAVKLVTQEAVKGKLLSERLAIAISSIGEACVPIDKRGNVLSNSIMYTDKRGIEEANRLKKFLGADKIMKITGLPIHSMYTICKIMWMKENLPHVFSCVWKILLFGDFIAYKFTQQTVIDYSLASRTMAFNVTTKKWSHEILEQAGVKMDLFSTPKRAGSIIGTIKKDIATEIGLPYKTIIVTGGHDQICGALGAGIIKKNRAVYGMGTAHCITTVFDAPIMGEKMLEYNYNCEPHLIEDMYSSLAFCFTGGALLKWYRDCFVSSKLHHISEKGTSVYDYLEKSAAKHPTGILVLPHFSGSGTPYMDPFSKGGILGLTLDTTDGQFYRALLEGVAYEMRLNLECQEKAGIDLETLRAVGGGSKSDLWMQIIADVIGKKIEILNIDEAGTVGTAILAGKALGIYDSYKRAVGKFINVKRTYYPNESRNSEYKEYYEKYKKVYTSMKNIFS